MCTEIKSEKEEGHVFLKRTFTFECHCQNTFYGRVLMLSSTETVFGSVRFTGATSGDGDKRGQTLGRGRPASDDREVRPLFRIFCEQANLGSAITRRLPQPPRVAREDSPPRAGNTVIRVVVNLLVIPSKASVLNCSA